MSDDVSIANVTVRIEDGKAALAELEHQIAALKATGDRSSIAKAALDQLKQDANEAAEQVRHLSTEQRKLARDSDEASNILARATGGTAFATHLNHLSSAFQITSDSSASFLTRIQALGGGLVLGGGFIIEAASQLYEWGKAMQEAEIHALNAQSSAARLATDMNSLAEATHGAVTAEAAFEMQEAAAQHGINMFGRDMDAQIGRFQLFADVHGGTATQAAERFSAAVEHGDNIALARFGVHANTALEGTERLRDAFDQLAQQNRDRPPIPPSVEEILHGTTTATNTLLASTETFGQRLIDTVAPERQFIRNLQDMHDQALAAQAAIDQTRQSIALMRQESARAAADFATQGMGWGAGPTAEQNDQSVNALFAHARQLMADAARRRAAAGAADARQDAAEARALGGLMEQASAATTRFADALRHGHTASELFHSTLHIVSQRFAEMQVAGREATRETDVAAVAWRNEAQAFIDSRAAAVTAAHSYSEQIRQVFNDTRTAAEKFAAESSAAVDQFSGAFANAMQSVFDGKEKFGDAMKIMAKQFLVGVGNQLMGDGLKSMLMGAARALATWGMDPTSEGMIVTGAAELAAGLALGASGAAVSVPATPLTGTGGGASMSASTPPATAGGPGGGGSGGNTTVIVNLGGMVGTKEQLGDHLRNTVQDMFRRGQLPTNLMR